MKSRKFSASLDHLHEILDWIHEEIAPFGRKNLLKLGLASEEALVNIIKHAYANRGGPIEIQIIPTTDQIQIVFIDQGIAFDPLSLEEPKVVSIEHQPIGGLGVSLMRKSVDDLLYRRSGDQNILTLIKNIIPNRY